MKLPYGSINSLKTALERQKFKLSRYTPDSLQYSIAESAIRKIEHQIKVTQKIVDIVS